MKRLTAYFLVFSIALLTGYFSYSKSPHGTDERKILLLMTEFHKAEQYKNGEDLERILADKVFWSRYKDEKTFSKEEIVAKILEIEFEIKSIETRFVFTEVSANQATVDFWMIVTFINHDGKFFDHQADYRYKFEKIQHEWKLTNIHLEN